MGAKISSNEAREIMGENFIGVEESFDCFKVRPTPEQDRIWSSIQIDSKILEEKNKTHLLVLNPGLSILKIWEASKKFETAEQKLFCGCNKMEFLAKQPFVQKVEAGWFLFKKEGIEDSNKKIRVEQEKLIKVEGEKMPTANQVISSVIARYILSGERLVEKYYVRTLSKNSDGTPIVVGMNDEKGMDIAAYFDHVKLKTLYATSVIV
ncbi:MAG: hypothetical protein PHG83_02055 [Patescibacteria group bacterium]|nr:hypothetical protein [Patescibacteria group bacterium]